ncbi:MAG: hypothetical protein ACREHD_25635, partial [Pirellulales bacterium]
MGFRNRASRFRLPRRPRLQYGLRSLLLATLVVCLALGWYVERVRRQRQAVAALREAGAGIDYSASGDPFADDALLENPTTCGEWLEFYTPTRLRGALGIDFFRRVESVDLGEADEIPPVLDQLRDLAGVRRLSLGIGLAVDDDLRVVGDLEDLTYLDASFSGITDAGLAHLKS